jgi:hypothetical protein
VVTDDTVAVNWALLDPAAIVRRAGSDTLALLSESVTATPPAGAAPLSVTVQVDDPGAFTLAGEQVKLLTVAGALRFTDEALVWPFQLAVTVAAWSLFTVPAVAVNVPLLDPVSIVTLAGTLNTPKLLDRATVAELVAALVSVTVQVALCPAPRVPGVQLSPDNCAGAIRFNVNVWVTPLALAETTAT